MRNKVAILGFILVLTAAIIVSIKLLMNAPPPEIGAESEKTNENEFETDFDIVVSASDKTCTITGIDTCTDTDINIPEKIAGYTVVSIGPEAFAEKKQITSVKLPHTVKTVEHGAFRNCRGLTEISLPEEVTFSDHHVFDGCNHLETVYCYEGSAADEYFSAHEYLKIYLDRNPKDVFQYLITENTVKITNYMGNGGNVVIPSKMAGRTVTKISNEAFSGCDNIKSVTIPETIMYIGKKAFYECTRLERVIFEGSSINIDREAFGECKKLKELHVKDLTSWLNADLKNYHSHPLNSGDGRLYINGILASDIIVPKNVTRIENYTFGGCSNLTGIELHDDVESIGCLAFYDCHNLKKINIPNGITKIQDMTFQNCLSLKILHLPDSIKSIEDQAFYGCESLISINIPNGVTKIGSYAFYDCHKLTSICIPDGVTHIDNSTFENCRGLENIYFPSGLTYMGISALSGCTEIEYISVDEDNDTFCDIDGVLFTKDKKELLMYPPGKQGMYEIPNTVTSIDSRAFNDCYGLTLVTIGSNVTYIPESTFSNCRNLVSISVDEGNKNYCDVDGVLFTKDKKTLLRYPGKGESEYTIPESVTCIEHSAFSDCHTLKKVTIPDGVTEIPMWAFQNCAYLKSVVIPDSVTEIGAYAFYNCYSLVSIVIPKSIDNIDNEAFYQTKLTSVYYCGNVEEWDFIIIGILNKIDASSVLFYSEAQPTDEGHYWHYVDGKPTRW